MKRQTQNSRQIVDRFLGQMVEPVSEEQSDRATLDVLDRLRTEEVLGVRMTNAEPELGRSRGFAWSAIAAAVVAMLAGSVLYVTLLRSEDPNIVARSARRGLQIAGRTDLFGFASRIHAGKVVKAGKDGGAIALLDGSQIDMSPGAELSVVRATDGLRVQLASGTVLVTAVKQREGHLYVETKDCVVSVVGTVFAVSAEESGSRVSVIEGEVHVQRGDISRTLLAGQQASTSPELGPLPADTGKGWVDSQRLALLQPLTVPPPQAPPVEPVFVVRGVVKQSSDGTGIPDVAVKLCPAAKGTPVRIGRYLTSQDQTSNDGQKTLTLRRNKAFFFALFDAAARCAGVPERTDSMGRFQFSNVAPGEYVATAEREGYMSPALLTAENRDVYRPGTPSGDSKNVTVDAKQPPEVSLTLIRGGVISGRVRDAEGRLVVNAAVRVLTVPAPGVAGDGEIALATTTNDLGEYRAYWVIPGEYRVVASGPVGRSSETWFPRGATSAEANAITVREGEEVKGIEIVLRPPQPDVQPLQPPGGRGAGR